ncbi:MAG TPA: hypothetical protein VER33_24865 [Polyangiaceae bacterium]|nr:hypothetical protein [Polyangiaceae bacterium]
MIRAAALQRCAALLALCACSARFDFVPDDGRTAGGAGSSLGGGAAATSGGTVGTGGTAAAGKGGISGSAGVGNAGAGGSAASGGSAGSSGAAASSGAGASGGAGETGGGPAVSGNAGSGNGGTGGSSGEGGAAGGPINVELEECRSRCRRHGLACTSAPPHECVECESNADCGPPRPSCDVVLRRCVGCQTQADCVAAGYGCERFSRECVPTCPTEVPDCSPGLQCDQRQGLCLQCSDESACLGSPNGPYCAPGGIRCVECHTNANCPQERQYCDPVLFRCVGCRDSHDCQSGQVCGRIDYVCR